MALERGRQYSMAGPQAISYQEIAAWARLTDRRLRPHEVEALMTLDAVTRAMWLASKEEDG